MAFENKVPLPGSERHLMPGSRVAGDVHAGETISVSVLLRRKEDVEQDLDVIEEFAHEYGLTVADADADKRRVVLTGTAEAMQQAFDAALKYYRLDETGPTFRARTGHIMIPEEMKGNVVAVLGMDNRPVAKPHFRYHKAAGPGGSFTPKQVADLYKFPAGATGAGQMIAIIELGGGYRSAELKKYFQGLGIKPLKVTAVSVDGGKNTPGGNADGEVLLDIEVAGAVAPGAKIAVYFAPNTDKGFVDAVLDAAHDKKRKPSVISISWGAPEEGWTKQARDAMDQALQDCAANGVTVTVASGDDGSTDGEKDAKLHVDFPASSPFALACGGTTLKGSGNTITSEKVWNETAQKAGATGGGVSTAFPLPAYQASAGVPPHHQTNFVGRGVPDIAGDADPLTGYQVLVDGQPQVIGGTSAVAPLWAGLIALLNQKLGKPVGFLNPSLYALQQSVTNDITQGNNDDGGLGAYSAKSGWDACTGLGSPNGTALLNALQSKTPTKKDEAVATGASV
jgi:kumamolisin